MVGYDSGMDVATGMIEAYTQVLGDGATGAPAVTLARASEHARMRMEELLQGHDDRQGLGLPPWLTDEWVEMDTVVAAVRQEFARRSARG